MVFAGTVAAMLFALCLIGTVHQATVVWPVSGTALGLSLPFWSRGWRSRVPLQLAGIAGAVAGGLLVGMPCRLAVLIGLLTGVDLVLAGLILRSHVQRLEDLKGRTNLKRFIFAALVCPVLSGLLGAAPVGLVVGSLFLRTFVTVSFANSLGFAIVAPLMLSVITWPGSKLRSLAPHTRRAALLYSAIFLASTSAIFYQNIGPFLFVVFPTMIPVLLTLGLEGAILISVSVTVIGFIATAHGHGPILLMARASPGDRLVALQLFDWICLATALPVGALLDDRRKTHQIAENAQSIIHGFQEFNPHIIYVKDTEGRYVSYNPAFAEFFGIGPSTWIGRSSYDLHPPAVASTFRQQDRQILETEEGVDARVQIAGCDGCACMVRSIKFPIVSANGTRFIGGIGVDITAEVENQRALASFNAQLEQLARTDALTGLNRRQVFEERIAIEFSVARRSGRPLSLLFIDLDNFKTRNDQFGHEAGDEALRLFGAILGRFARTTDVPARFGGEEFVLLLPETPATEAVIVADRLLEALRSLDAGPLPLTASIGIANMEPGTPGWKHLIAQADDAMYIAKTTGKDRYAVAYGLANLARFEALQSQ